MDREICKHAAELFSGRNWNDLSEKEKYLAKLLIGDGYLDPLHGFEGQEAAKFYAHKDWHKLSHNERELIAMLEKEGHLIPNVPADGFVGKAA